ncbi:alpha/beta hydrolase [Sphingomonas sp.]|uniref:alpha/beta fold hydrolase n=1 Tax=Sphingomonas sp. TaxID=28214 RepID=UPI000DB09C4D|nr:alpha/beta hydrolase [Sphingomonas sp.]PZU06476.1 MAG: hypothetical protein DI605_18670 [Sphingomonas sp.]
MVEPCAGWVEANGASLRFRREGRGTTIVLLHEMGGALESWNLVAPELALNHEVVRFDLRGSGLSEKIRTPVSLEVFVADLAVLLDRLEIDSPIVAGGALGGGIALAFAASHPERSAGVIAFAPATGVPAERRAHAATFHERLVQKGIAATVDEAMSPSAWPDEDARRRPGFGLFRALQKAADPESSGHQNAMLLDADVAAFAPPARVPVRLIAGRADAMRGPAVIRDFAARIPHASIGEIESGHFMVLQAPDRVTAEIAAFAATIGS